MMARRLVRIASLEAHYTSNLLSDVGCTTTRRQLMTFEAGSQLKFHLHCAWELALVREVSTTS